MAKSATATTMDSESFGGKVMSAPQRIKTFYTEVRSEMKKVTSPSRKEVQATTIVVIVTVFLFGLYFWGVDTVIGNGMSWVLKAFAQR
jgi:preprotein translocase subunit SecE